LTPRPNSIADLRLSGPVTVIRVACWYRDSDCLRNLDSATVSSVLDTTVPDTAIVLAAFAICHAPFDLENFVDDLHKIRTVYFLRIFLLQPFDQLHKVR